MDKEDFYVVGNVIFLALISLVMTINTPALIVFAVCYAISAIVVNKLWER